MSLLPELPTLKAQLEGGVDCRDCPNCKIWSLTEDEAKRSVLSILSMLWLLKAYDPQSWLKLGPLHLPFATALCRLSGGLRAVGLLPEARGPAFPGYLGGHQGPTAAVDLLIYQSFDLSIDLLIYLSFNVPAYDNISVYLTPSI